MSADGSRGRGAGVSADGSRVRKDDPGASSRVGEGAARGERHGVGGGRGEVGSGRGGGSLRDLQGDWHGDWQGDWRDDADVKEEGLAEGDGAVSGVVELEDVCARGDGGGRDPDE